MEAQNIMTKMLACCLPDTPLSEATLAMVEHDCGAIPVVENKQSMRLLGIITDRDITCRTVAQGKNPLEMTVKECMSSPVITVVPEMSLEDCCKVMEDNQVRRIPVVDEKGICYGIVTQAHVAQHAQESQIARVLKRVSRPTLEPSRVASR